MMPERKDPQPILVWDLPTRICHWGLAACVTGALGLALCFAPGSEAFAYHMPLGSLAAAFLAARLVLAILGSPHTRWRAFLHGPVRTLRYLADVVRARRVEWGPLNPGSAAFALALHASLVSLLVTGFEPDWVETWHGRIAWSALGLIGLHLTGLTLHALRHRSPTPLAMVHGRAIPREALGPARERRAAGLVLLAAALLLAWLVLHGFDATTSEVRWPAGPSFSFPLIQKG